jgi:hypothetical protein
LQNNLALAVFFAFLPTPREADRLAQQQDYRYGQEQASADNRYERYTGKNFINHAGQDSHVTQIVHHDLSPSGRAPRGLALASYTRREDRSPLQGRSRRADQ